MLSRIPDFVPLGGMLLVERATFVGVEDEETAAQKGAYAKEMSDAFRQKQAEIAGRRCGPAGDVTARLR